MITARMQQEPKKPNKTSVVNIRRHPRDYDVYVGRVGLGFDGTFGNPFRIPYDGDRDTVIEKYRKYFYKRIGQDDDFAKKVLALKGRRLGCFCAPRACHADVLAAYLNHLT